MWPDDSAWCRTGLPATVRAPDRFDDDLTRQWSTQQKMSSSIMLHAGVVLLAANYFIVIALKQLIIWLTWFAISTVDWIILVETNERFHLILKATHFGYASEVNNWFRRFFHRMELCLKMSTIEDLFERSGFTLGWKDKNVFQVLESTTIFAFLGNTKCFCVNLEPNRKRFRGSRALMFVRENGKYFCHQNVVSIIWAKHILLKGVVSFLNIC